MNTHPGVAPAAVEGSESSGAVVVVQADGDHTGAGGTSGHSTLTVDDLLAAIAGARLDPETPVHLEVLGDLFDVDGISIDTYATDAGGYSLHLRIIGAEVVE